LPQNLILPRLRKCLMRLKTEQIHLMSGESFRLLQWRKNLRDVELVTINGKRCPFAGSGHEWHHHPQTELTLIEQGTGTLFIGNSITSFKAPDLVMIGANLPHYWHMRHASSGYSIQFDFGPTHPFWQFSETQELKPLWRNISLGVRISGPALGIVAQQIHDSLKCNGMGRLAHFFKIQETLSTLPQSAQKKLSSMTFAPPARQTTYRGLQQTIDFVFSHFHENISLVDVLNQAAMSKATFERRFKQHTGKTLTQFIAEVRLNAASRQLIETDWSIAEIALSTGFNTISHFNHLFRASRGLSPRNFRNSALKAESTTKTEKK